MSKRNPSRPTSTRGKESPEWVAKRKRELYLRRLWIAYWEKHMPVKGHLHRRYDTREINFEYLQERGTCPLCGRRKHYVNEFCYKCVPEIRGMCPGTSAAIKARRDKKRRRALRKKGEVSGGDVLYIGVNPERSDYWPPLGSYIYDRGIKVEALENFDYWYFYLFLPDEQWFIPDSHIYDKMNEKVRRENIHRGRK